MPDMTMDEFFQKLLNEYETTTATLFTHPEEWRKFLSTSCYNYKLRFDQQVLLYAQNPQATIVATHQQWYNLYRPVKPNMKAIYVFEVEGGKNKKYTRYYEPSSTRELRNSKPIPFWQMKRGYKGIVVDALKTEFEDFSDKRIELNTKSFEQEIILAAETIANNEIESYYDYILEDTEYTELEELEEETIIDTFNSIVTNSVAYAMLSRLGYNADKIIDPTVFEDIKMFNSESTLSIVGKATQQITQTGLNVVAKAIRQFEREVQNDRTRIQGDDTGRKARIQHGIVREQRNDSGLRGERRPSNEISRQDQQPLVSVQRGTESIRPDVRDPGGRGTGDREILNGAERLSGVGEISDVRENALFGNSEQTLQRTPEGVHSNGRETNGADEQGRGNNSGTSEQGLVDLRSDEGEPQEESTGNSSERNGLRLNNNDNEQQQAEIEDDSTSASPMPDDTNTETEKSFAEQVDDVLSGNADRYNDLKVCDTPQILIDIGCQQLPIFYTQKHLRDALKAKGSTGESIHHHGLTSEQIKNIPIELENPVLIYDSLSRNDSIVVVTSKVDNDNSPIIAVLRPNGKAKYNLEVVDSNFLLSIHGRNNFENQINRAVTDNKILYINNKKSQELFSVLGLQLSKGLNNLDFDTIIHQSNHIVNSQSAKNSPSPDNASEKNDNTADVIDLTIEFSEHPAFYDRNGNDRYCNISFALANRLIETLDQKQHEERDKSDVGLYYYKTNFKINAVINGEEFNYSGRYDIGDGVGDLITHIQRYREYLLSTDSPFHTLQHSDPDRYEQITKDSQDVLNVLVPYLREHTELTPEDEQLLEEIMSHESEWFEVAADEQDYSYLLGEKITLDGKEYTVDSIEPDNRTVTLRDDNTSWYPLFHNEELNTVAELYNNTVPNEPEQTADTVETPTETTSQTAAENIPSNKKIDFDLSAHPVETAGPKVRYQRNAAAIKTLKLCQSEGRLATPEEQVTLSKYVGWGGLQEAFDPNKNNWASEYKELRSLLTEDEYKAARASTRTAFFTPPEVTTAMWKAIESFGFERGNILEPSCGIGNFIGMIPDKMKESRVYGVELDRLSADMSKQLYQSANIVNAGYEKTNYPDNFFDIAVGNVPFSDYKLNDKRYNKYNFYIHDYFFAKTLDKVRPGGIVAFITSQGTMDKENPKIRKYIAQRAELVGAIRLPDNTFKGNAGTDVTSDIIFLQKRERMTEIEPDWVNLDIDKNGITMNSYFVNHPEMIMGEMVMKSGPYGPVSTCRQIEGTDLSEMLNRAIQNMSAVITENTKDDTQDFEEETESVPADPNVRENSYTIIDSDIYYRQNSLMYKRDFADEKKPEDKIARIKAIIPIRDSLRKLIELQTYDHSEESIKEEQRNLNVLYDRFSAKFGRLNDRANRLAFYDDSSAELVLSLEKYDNEKFAGKADIFSKRTISPHITITHVDTSAEALAVSLGERASVDMEYMCSLTNKSEEQIYNELAGAIFLNPRYSNLTKDFENKYIARDEYLSGNVREKYSEAVYYNKESGDNSFQINVTELEKVIPKDLSPAEISAPLGAAWIPQKYVNQFIYEEFDVPYYLQDYIHADYTKLGSEWTITGKNQLSNFKSTTVYGTKRRTGLSILEDTLNLRTPKVSDPYQDDTGKTRYKVNETETQLAKDKQEDLKLAFDQWIWKDPERRQELVELYNNKFNSIVPREYDGSNLTFAGMNPEFKLRKHQLNAVARVIYGGNTLLAHCVGAGKTFEMIAAAQESKRLGLCNKSLFVVPKHLLRQWANEYMTLYPGANILVSTPKDFTRDGRRKFTAKIATGDYDAVLITQPQFDKIQLTPEYQQKVIEQEIDRITQVMDSSQDSLTVKASQRILDRLTKRYEALKNSESKDDVIYFEELGIDRIFVDESQAYKNLYHPTKMQNVPGLASSESKRATGMHMICRYLDEKTDGKGVIFATGTPLANSLSEVYTIMYNLQYSLLEKTNMTNFDSWISTFASATTNLEPSIDSKHYVEKTRFSEFSNIPELKRMVFEVMDIQTAEMLKLPVPEAQRETILLKSSPEQKSILESFAERAENYKHKQGNYSPAEMLLITMDARKMSLDQRVYDSILPDNDYNKTSACSDKIVEIYHQYESTKGTQMVFCDMSTPGGANSKEFCIYDDLKAKLIAKGIPEEEIKFIHEADTDEKKDRLFKAMREGNVRVLIGSTEKMGTGTNVQKKLIALHHLDCPWRPMDLEQQEGRIIRQGNENKKVHIFTYVTEGTFDSNMYQTIARKQKAVSQFYSKDMTQRKCEDIAETVLNYLDVAAITSGNPLIKEQAELQKDVTKLTRQKTTFMNAKYALQDKIEKEYPEKISRLEKNIPLIESDLETARANPKTEEFSGMTVREKYFDTRKDAGTALMQAAKLASGREKIEIGSYRGFKLYAMYSAIDKELIVGIRGKRDYNVTMGKDPVGNITRLDNAISSIEDRLTDCKNKLEQAKTDYSSAKEEIKKDFPHEKELKEKKARIDEIIGIMSDDKSDKTNDKY